MLRAWATTSACCWRMPVRRNSEVTTGREAATAGEQRAASSAHDTTTVWGCRGETGQNMNRFSGNSNGTETQLQTTAGV